MSNSILEGLPSASCMQKPGDVGETFSSLRVWVRRMSQQGDLVAAGSVLDHDHKRSIFDFLREVSKTKIRQKQSEEVLGKLMAIETWDCRRAADTSTSSSRKDGSASQDCEAISLDGLPSEVELDLSDSRTDVREAFTALRNWLKAKQQSNSLVSAGRFLSTAYKQRVFEFLCAIPGKKPIFQNQARELLKALADVPEWQEGIVIDAASISAALDSGKSARCSAKDVPSAASNEKPEAAGYPTQGLHSSLAAPPPPPSAEQSVVASLSLVTPPPPPEDKKLLEGMPPHVGFDENSRYDLGDTFIDFRKWARSLAVWDLASAGYQLQPELRSKVFCFLTRVSAERKIYRNQVREVLSMLLSIDDWTDNTVLDEAAISRILDSEPCKTKVPPPPLPPPLQLAFH
eukprot:gnl/MRDRNA2_/MRDRNA2_35104_c0_seq1.p1 gnl/MRDRNA2_/MRDRNA2_35104_c0~~gnl/MRDRNA2_/MRDRNA2_35104_c0_seq1.p1  ORF type:complete len:402 (-),score=84.75 gnl/MRDRNA2_/MRDRNA2_35104_c0_seq1:201-1406(-)